MSRPRTSGPTCVSLFTGAGGLDIGLERSGFHTLAAVELNKDCVATLRANQERKLSINPMSGRMYLDSTRLVEGDIGEVCGSDLTRSRPTLLAGGPPCQPFSSAGSQRGMDDPRGRLFRDFVRLADELQPRFILFENVRGLATARGPAGRPGEVLEYVRAEFEDIGYHSRFALLNTADFGAPQRRVRLFMFASRDRALPEFPSPTHGKMADSTTSLKPWVTLRELLEPLQPPEPDDVILPSAKLGEQLKSIPSGSGLKSPGRSEPTRPSGHWGYKQGTFIADLSLPARTVTAASTNDWIRMPNQPLRRLSVRECAAIQGFPANWTFVGNRASTFKQIGNAVPCILGEVLGRVLIEAAAKKATRVQSAPLPREIQSAISYTTRDDRRNGAVRPRSPRYAERSA